MDEFLVRFLLIYGIFSGILVFYISFMFIVYIEYVDEID